MLMYGTGKKFYDGTEEAENIIHFPSDLYYYSETEPIPNEVGEIGDYWHYDEDGNPVEWKNETIDFAYTVIDTTPGANYNEHADKLFDRDIKTKWCVSFDSNYAYVIFRAEEAITINGYTFTTANDNDEYAGRNPKSWTIYGSNDENCAGSSYEDWKEICSVTDDETMKDVNYTAYTFSIDGNTTAYRYYKIVFTANGGSNLQLSELSLSYT